jgi:hypothetical protein
VVILGKGVTNQPNKENKPSTQGTTSINMARPSRHRTLTDLEQNALLDEILDDDEISE